MIPTNWLVLLAGYSVSGILVFYSDFKRGTIYDGAWVPALLAVAYFYLTLSPLVVFLLLIRGLPIAAISYVVLRLLSKRVGSGDAIALGIFALWPDLLFTALGIGCLLFFLLNLRHRYMTNFKLAGILGGLALPIGAYLLLI